MTELSQIINEIENIINNKNAKNWYSIDKDIVLEKVRFLYQKISNINTSEENSMVNKIAENETIPSNSFIQPNIENKNEDTHSNPIINEPIIAIEKNDSNTKSLNDILNQNRKNDLAEVLEHLPIKDLRASIGFNDKFSLINNLFDGDESAYRITIENINNCVSKNEANDIINRLSNQANWLKNAATVELLKDLINRKFQ
ncbi:MAG: hypothetical protein RIQ33_1224 [Bacteroidota bacterium]|jgi:hypothetical protein